MRMRVDVATLQLLKYFQSMVVDNGSCQNFKLILIYPQTRVLVHRI